MFRRISAFLFASMMIISVGAVLANAKTNETEALRVRAA